MQDAPEHDALLHRPCTLAERLVHEELEGGGLDFRGQKACFEVLRLVVAEGTDVYVAPRWADVEAAGWAFFGVVDCYCEKGVAVDCDHLLRFAGPIVGAVLTDTERVNPEVADP